MKKLALLSLVLVLSLSCEKETIPTSDVNQSADDLESLNVVKSTSSSTQTDATGTIELIQVSTDFYSNQSSNQNLITKNVYVPSNYVCIGASVVVSYGNGQGALLTRSAPIISGGKPTNGWQVQAKAHAQPNGEVWSISVDAVGIRIKNSSGNWLSSSALKNYLQAKISTSSSSGNPSATATLSSSYGLIGGGAKVNWSGYGNLLTESYPSGSSWKVKSKDHLSPSPATITSYAIGLKKSIPNVGTFSFGTGSNCEYTPRFFHNMSATNYLSNQKIITGAGARATYNGNGRMLTGWAYGISGMQASSKDHLSQDSGYTCAYFATLGR